MATVARGEALVNGWDLRVVAPVAVTLALLGSGCGHTASDPGRRGATEDQQLFGKLDEPALEERAAPRLVLRDGPAVPEAPTEMQLGRPGSPPAAPPPPAAVEPLRVLSWAPTGRDDLVGAVRVTFSQPMVPVEQLSALSVEHAPLAIAPLPPGRFRWLGTTTLAFEPIGRMPKSTHYSVTVPAGTASALGGRLARAVTFAFDTPAPTRDATLPSFGQRSVGTDTLVGVLFDQRIDPAVVARTARLEGAGAPALVPLTGDELARAKERVPRIQSWPADRSVVMRPASALTPGTSYTLRIRRGLVGLEGPRPMERDLEVPFETFRPLRITRADCDYTACKPGRTIAIRFNSELREQDFASRVTVTPEVPRLEIVQSYGALRISGDFAAQTRYSVNVSAELEDVFGQHLGRAESRAFAFGDADAQATIEAQTIATLELGGPRSVPVSLVNVPMVGTRVAPVPRAKLAAGIRAAMTGRGWYRDEDPFTRAGLTPTSSSLATRLARNQEERVGLPLGSALPAGRPGSALVEIDVPTDGERHRYETVLVTATDLGVVATADSFATIVRVTSLSTGAPVGGAAVELVPAESNDAVRPSARPAPPAPPVRAVTDREGIARLAAPASGRLVLASKGEDLAIATVGGSDVREALVGSVYTDRSPYRPGDTAHVRVVARRRLANARADLRSIAGQWMVCNVLDGDRERRARFEGRLSPYGTLAHDVALPAGASLGRWEVQCHLARNEALEVEGGFEVQEYRAPEIQVEVTAPAGDQFVGDRPTLEIASSYLFGAPAAGLPVRYTVGREGTTWQPDGHDGYVFGTRVPWRTVARGTFFDDGRSRLARFGAEREVITDGQGVLDSRGRLRVPVELAPGELEGPVKLVLEAAVTDASRQEVAGRVEVVAHPASVYVGLHVDNRFIRAQDPIQARVIATAIDGTFAVGRRVEVRAVERRSRLVVDSHGEDFAFHWEDHDREVGRCTVTSAAAAADCRIAPQRPGTYVLEATTTDDRHRTAKTTTSVWVTGPGWVPQQQQSVELLPEKTEVAPGDTARILVRAPFAHGRGLVTFERLGVVESRAIDLEGSVGIVEVPVTAVNVPSLTVRVSLARGRASREELAELLASAGPDALRAAEQDIGRPMFATAETTLTVSDAPKRLTVSVRPDRETHSPGERMSVEVEVHEPGGRPADAEVAVMAVDEGVLSLLGFETPDPVQGLFEPIQWGVGSTGTQASVVAQQPQRTLGRRGREADALGALMGDRIGEHFGFGGLGLRGTGRGGGGTGEGTIGLGSLGTMGHGGGGGSGSGYGRGAGGESEEQTRSRRGGGLGQIPTSTRALFATTAFYAAAVRTDRTGKARVHFELPGNLTTFRIMAVAIGREDRTGSGDAKVQVRKQLLLRPALPRFATLGDRFEAQVVVHNETSGPADVSVGIRAAGLTVQGEPLTRVHLARGEAKRVSFPVRVEAGRGIARVQFAASTRTASDAVDTPIPLVEPATSEAFSTYGSLESGAVRIPVRVPTGSHPAFGRLEVTLGSTALTSLDDAADWLVDYPYECGEQTASKLIAASALADVLDGRSIAGRARARDIAAESVGKLQRLRRGRGFTMWPEDDQPELYGTAWITLALVRAKAAGIAVPDELLRRALGGLGNMTRYPDVSRYEHVAWVEQALALYTLAEAHSPVPDRDLVLDRVWGHRTALPLFAKAWLAVAIADAHPDDPRVADLLRELDNAVVESAGTASFGELRVESDRLLWHSEARTNAIALGTLLRLRAGSPLIEKVVRGLLAERHDGRWETTQDNAWALDSLTRYWREREAETPSLVAQAWLGSRHLGETRFEGRSTRVSEGIVPMSDLRRLGDSQLVIAESGQGRLYYRVGLRYAPASLRMLPEEQGFSVTRSYEALGEPAQVRRDPDGTWHIKAGADVRVRLTVVVPTDRFDVAIDDPLPAGLEAVNMTFRTTATQRISRNLDERFRDTGDFWAVFAFDHRELRDDKMVAFARQAYAGVYELTYAARATTPGTFMAQPTHAEEMYAPETFGRTGTDVVVVDP